MAKLLDIFKDNFLKENKCIFKKFKPIKKIGSGTFGNVYSVLRLKDKEMFAMKIEETNFQFKTLETEAYHLFLLQEGVGIPKFISYGVKKNYNILIETLLDKNLYDIFIEGNRKCSVIDTCLIALQILDRLKWIHSKDLIYRDVKPSNFLIGKKDPNIIYIVDFGLCKKYRSSKTRKHILPKTTGKFQGTLKYASSNVIKGKEPSRRDDLISLGYMLIYLLKRELPWKITKEVLIKKHYMDLIYSKEKDGDGKLFENIPEGLKEYIQYTKKLKFEQDPDYSYMSSIFINILWKINSNYRTLTFSWINPKDKHLIGLPTNYSLKKSTPQNRLIKSIELEISRRSNDNYLSLNNFNSKFLSNNNNSTDNRIYKNNNEQSIINFQRRRKMTEQKLHHYEPKKNPTIVFNAYKSSIFKKISPPKTVPNINNTDKNNMDNYKNNISLNKNSSVYNQSMNCKNFNNKIYQSIFKFDEKEKNGNSQNNKNYKQLIQNRTSVNKSYDSEKNEDKLMKKLLRKKIIDISNNRNLFSKKKFDNFCNISEATTYKSPLLKYINIQNHINNQINFIVKIPSLYNFNSSTNIY